jgi:predicted  nucleic acid-binding Zn ribbon protein
MASRAGEKFGYKQISELNSELTKFGRELCATLEKQTSTKVFYYLHRYRETLLRSKSRRTCPGCGNKWILQESNLFRFRCDKCRLISTDA